MDYTGSNIELDSSDFGDDPNLSSGKDYELMHATFVPHSKGKCEIAHVQNYFVTMFYKSMFIVLTLPLPIIHYIFLFSRIF